jgi:cytosine/adenosine deaminase-related metal-dependent hydrolase
MSFCSPPARIARLVAGRALSGPDFAAEGPLAVDISGDGAIAAIERPVALSDAEQRLLLLPALANAHDHGWGLRPLAFGAADDHLEAWLVALSRNPSLDPYLRALVAFARMTESGVGATNHCHNTQNSDALVAEAEGVSRAARDCGLRVAFAMPFFDRNATVYGDREALLARLNPEDRLKAGAPRMRPLAVNLELMDRISAFEHEYFAMQYGPVAPQWTDRATLEAIAEASARTGRRVHMHCLETIRQREWADAHYAGGLFGYLDAVGLLSPRLTLAHGTWLRPDECELLAARGVSVSVNCSSNMRLRSGAPPLEAIAASQLNIGLGMDGLSFDDDDDMLREMRLLWRTQGLALPLEPNVPHRVLHAAFIGGRRTISGEDGGGRLAEGAPADLLVLDYAAMTYDFIDPDVDVRSVLLARATRRHVRKLLVGGRLLVEDGRCLSVDLPAAEAELIASARRTRADQPEHQAFISRLQAAIAQFYKEGGHRR